MERREARFCISHCTIETWAKDAVAVAPGKEFEESQLLVAGWIGAPRDQFQPQAVCFTPLV